MKKIVVGVIAHVDAGKTTLSEALLFLTGRIKKLGRVDHRDSFLDTHELERARGITIFSKQAVLRTKDAELMLLDTPGHVDFSAETERTLQVLDYAVLVISGSDGVQAHTETLWRLLNRYHIPTFIFVTKMDLTTPSEGTLMRELRRRLSERCVNFSALAEEGLWEAVALCDESILERYIQAGTMSDGDIAGYIRQRYVYPCFFGSGLKLEGVDRLLAGLETYTLSRDYPEAFAARVYKIARDAQGNRLSYMKINGGSLRVRENLSYTPEGGEGELCEKVTQLRVYSGLKFEAVDTAEAGTVCAVVGLSATYAGQGLGAESAAESPVLEPVLSYRLRLPKGCEPREIMPKLMQLEEEDPELHLVWNENLREIHAQLMGEIQLEVLKSIISQRFGVDVNFDAGRILYRETITEPVEGVGHFEPLRHYAEVHLLIEPAERGSGVWISSKCPEDDLDRSWQRLIMTHLYEKRHRGVLIGAPLTDVKISLVAGRAHLKHTEGGDFRQATYRAVRQGLMKAKSLLLEPFYAFRLEIPVAETGRAINDIRAMRGTFSSPEEGEDGLTLIRGRAPVSEMRDYMQKVRAYTHGRGRLSCVVDGFSDCHNTAEVLADWGYDPESDLDNTPDSVFCAHGAGFIVKWDRVEDYMHLESGVKLTDDVPSLPDPKVFARNLNIDEKELEAIMEREFGPIKRPEYRPSSAADRALRPVAAPLKQYYLIDGYNVIFAWEGLARLAEDDLEAARHRLMEVLANYRGYKKCEMVLIFDGYRVKGNRGERFDYHGLHVAFTKEDETGDMYIERLTQEIGSNYAVRVVTSDNLVQQAALHSGMLRMSSREFYEEIERVNEQIRELISEFGRTTRRQQKL